MKNQLDLLELRLQGLIESSVTFFAKGDAQYQLAHQLVEAMRDQLDESPEGSRTFSPSDFIVYLHPEQVEYWQAHQTQIELIAQSLQQAAREVEVYFAHEPLLHLSADPRLPIHGLRVVPAGTMHIMGNTSTLVPRADALNDLPRNAFLIVGGNHILPLQRAVINIGRRADNHVVLSDPRVSRDHAQIRVVRGQFVLFDLNSTGGTFVNGRKIVQYTLQPGDVISLSGVTIIYGADVGGEDDDEQTGSTRATPSAPTDPLSPDAVK